MMQNKHRYSKFVNAAILIVSLLGFQNTEAQKTMNLTMDQAIQLSLQSNKQLKVGQARVDEAQAQLNQAKDNMLPDVKMSGS